LGLTLFSQQRHGQTSCPGGGKKGAKNDTDRDYSREWVYVSSFSKAFHKKKRKETTAEYGMSFLLNGKPKKRKKGLPGPTFLNGRRGSPSLQYGGGKGLSTPY